MSNREDAPIDQTFTKYRTQGAYHWSFTYNEQLRRYNPRMHALYDVPLRLLRRHQGINKDKIGLEIGCGDGVLLYKVTQASGRIVGVDVTYDGLLLAQQQIESRTKRSPQLVNASCYHLPFPGQSFDYVVSVEVIEHLTEPDRYLSEIHRVLRLQGVIVLTTPHRTVDGQVQDPFHVHEYTGPELAASLRKHFPQVSVWGMCPAVLDRLYFRATGIAALDKVMRSVFKMVAKWGANPYLHLTTPAPKPGWANLVALCVTEG